MRSFRPAHRLHQKRCRVGVNNFVHRVGAKRHCTHMKFLHFHLCRNKPFRKVEVELGKRNTILGQCTVLVAEKILNSAEFFR